jgi:hypothetical protein
VTLLSKAQRKLLAAGNYEAVYNTLPPKTPRKPKKPMKRRRTSVLARAEKFEREYGSEERVEWISLHGCLACAKAPCENHHTANGGKGRKGPYTSIVPLCLVHHAECHHGVKSFEAKYARMLCGRTLKSWAETYADAWKKWEGQ